MKHTFLKSILNPEQCAICTYDEISHGSEAECESCGQNRPCEIVDKMLMCDSCATRNVEVANELAQIAELRINPLEVIIKPIDMDESIQIRSDFFNSRTASIQALKESIDSDETITNKNFELANRLDARFKKLRDILLPEKKLEIEAIASEQKAIQIYLNNLASSLRKEEREKLRISDISYQPAPVQKPRTPKAPSKKIDKEEVRKYAAELGINEYTLQVFVISKGCSVADAAQIIREQLAKAKELNQSN